MANNLAKSWSSFSKEKAKAYMKSFGSPLLSTKHKVGEIIKGIASNKKIKLIELGCGNGQMYEYLKEVGISLEYIGVDFSEPLIRAGKEMMAKDVNVSFLRDDVCELSRIKDKYDVVLYSHVVEILSSPEMSIIKASKIAPIVIIRYFEAPEYEYDTVELQEMDLGLNGKVPYIRRKMSRDYYRLILQKAKCRKADVYVDESSPKDQVHVLYFK